MKKRSVLRGPVKSKLAWSIAAALSLSAGISSVALAQEEEESARALEEVTVTGSRIRRDDFSNAQPTTVVGSDMLENLGIVNLGDAMASLPSNVGNNTPTANPGGNFFNGSNIANLRGLNPFFGSRTLTLVDSRRHVPTNQGDGVDLNFVPSILIDRMEVVTGGASASYGSGAIGGVTNILLDRDLEGGKVQVDWGTTAESDGDDLHYGVAWGTAIGDAGHFVVGYEAQDMDAITNCAQARDWCAKGVYTEENRAFATTPEPRYLTMANGRNAYLSETGVVFTSPFFAAGFNGARNVNAAGTGSTAWDDAGSIYGRAFFDGNQPGGEGNHIYHYTNLRSNVDRETLYLSYTHEFSDSLNGFVEYSTGSVETFSPQGALNDTFRNVPATNAYFQNAGLDALFPNGAWVSKDWGGANGAAMSNETTTDLDRYAFGLSGAFGDTSWTWDVYYQYGESDRKQQVNNNRHLNAYNFAVDAVRDANGNIVCRVTRDGTAGLSAQMAQIAQGCVPLNIFGARTLTAAEYNYSFGFLRENTTVEQDIFEGVASGEIFEGFGAGAVRAAVGASWREESIANIAAEEIPEYIRTDYLIQYGGSFSGDVEVLEYFSEVDIPVTEGLSLQGAIRRSEYTNTAGAGTGVEGREFEYGITTWKGTANWTINDWLTLRGSQSRDIRAPNFRELYYSQTLHAGGIFGFCNNEWTANSRDECSVFLWGGLDLQPEEADTTTFGFILTPPEWSLRFASDFYQIEIEEAITPASSGLVLDACHDSRDPKFCGQMSGTLVNPADPLSGFSDIVGVNAYAFNYRSYKVRGIDFTADWLGEFDFGTISSRLIASRVIEQKIQPSTTDPSLTRNIAGVTGASNGFLADWAASPDWTAQWINTYMKGAFTATISGRWVNEGLRYATGVRQGPGDPGYNPNNNTSADDNSVPSYVVWALNGSYDFTLGDTEMSVFGSVQNLLDKDPPLIGSGVGGTNATFFDTIGRNYRVGIRAQF